MRGLPGVIRSARTCARSESQTSFSSPLPLNSPWLSGSKKPQKLRSARKPETKFRGFGGPDELDELDELPLDLAGGPDGRGERDELGELPPDLAGGRDGRVVNLMKVLFCSQLV